MKYDAKVMFSEFLSFCPQGGGGGVKIEKCSECHGKPKKSIKIFSDYTPFDQVGEGGGGVLSSNFVHQMCHQGGGVIWWTKLELRTPPSLAADLVDKVGTKDPPSPPGGTSGGQSWN